MLRKSTLFIFWLGTVALIPVPAATFLIGTYTWSGTDNTNAPGYLFQGSADFYNVCVGTGCSISSTSELEIVLTNSAGTAASTNPEMLGGFMFNIAYASGTPGALSMLSATATTGLFASKGASASSPGANVCAPGAGENGVAPGCSTTVSGGWDAVYNASGVSTADAPGANWGVGSAGFSGASTGGVFNGSNVGNIDYEIGPSAGVTFNGASNYPVVDGTITFVFTGLTAPVTTVNNTYAWYGTAPDDAFTSQPQLTVPEPASVAELSIGGAFLLAVFSRRRRKQVLI